MNFKKILEDLIVINAPSKREQKVSLYIKNFALENDINIIEFEDCIPEGGNCAPLLLKVEGSKEKESILISSHMDTVAINHNNPIEIIRDGNIYKSNGENILGGDDRLGVAICLIIAKKAKENPTLHGGLEVLFNVQEELGCLGTKILDYNLIESQNNYNLDGETPVGTLINKAPTKVIYNLEVIGKASHAALAPDDGKNAIVALSKIISNLPQGQLDFETTANIGIIRGGSQTNVVAEKAVLSSEIRSLSFEKYLIWKDKIIKIIESESKSLAVKVNYSFNIIYNGYDVKEDEFLIQEFQKACYIKNIKPMLLTSQGGGDSNNLNDNGIKSVVFGLAMNNIHTLNESFDIEDYYKAISLLETILFEN